MHDYSGFYATLGVTPDTDWKTLRGRYRRLIGQWHPDRFSGDVTGKQLAEERTKHITLAYQALERYRRVHGVLPPMQSAAPWEGATRAPDSHVRSARAASVPGNEAAAANAAAGVAKPPPKPWRRGAAIALAAFVVAMYFALDPFTQSEPGEPAPAGSASEASTAPAPAPVAKIPETDGGIRVGSTLGDVYAIQGVPSSTQGDSWHYGKSRIRFAQGKVISWEEDVDNPLRIDRHQAVLESERFFGVGSTKEEVRAAQGTPISETDSVWYYEPSKVYFEDNRVVRWEESPMLPLHVAR